MSTPESTPTHLGQPYARVDLNPMPESTLSSSEDFEHNMSIVFGFGLQGLKFAKPSTVGAVFTSQFAVICRPL